MLVVELWGLGDIALAIPFLRTATLQAQVTLLAKPHAGPLLRRFAPEVEPVFLDAPWTQFTGKYRLHQWPWRTLRSVQRELRNRHFDLGISARPDPRDHLLLNFIGVSRCIGFPRAGSGILLTTALAAPTVPHRANHWKALATTLGWGVPKPIVTKPASRSRRIVIHTGAGQRVREWPRARFEQLAATLRAEHWEVVVIDHPPGGVAALLDLLATADRFIGNDSGPGHLAALLGVPTFTIFGPQLPELFSPQHPQAGWIEGSPCAYKPCFDACRFAEPSCLTSLTTDQITGQVRQWLDQTNG